MANSMTALISLLAEEERALLQMADLLTEEQQSLLAMDHLSLEEVNRRKTELTTRLASLSEQCRLLMTRAGAERGGDLGVSPHLSRLVEVASPSEQERLKPIQKRLVDLASAMERQASVNRRVLANATLIVQRSLSLFGRLLGGVDTYGDQGRVGPVTSAISFVSREV